jgi:uncharacterized protein (DUF1810 family)
LLDGAATSLGHVASSPRTGRGEYSRRRHARGIEPSAILEFVLCIKAEEIWRALSVIGSRQTLFREAASEQSDRELFTKALEQFYRGDADARTLALLR